MPAFDVGFERFRRPCPRFDACSVQRLAVVGVLIAASLLCGFFAIQQVRSDLGADETEGHETSEALWGVHSPLYGATSFSSYSLLASRFSLLRFVDGSF